VNEELRRRSLWGIAAAQSDSDSEGVIDLLFPVLFFAVRYAIAQGASRLIAERITQARSAALRVVNEIFLSTTLNVIVNIGALLGAIYGLHGRLPERELVLVVSTVYAASVLHVGLKFALNAYWIYDVSCYLLRHGVHGPRAWVRSHVAREVHRRFQQMGWLKRLAYAFSGAPRKEDLVEILTREIWQVAVFKVFATVAIIAVYTIVFSLHTRPILVEEATRLNWLQAFLWPFGYSLDYFFHTHSTAWIERALRF